jgi:DNA polymerase I-like protein with 3'-5' exonuclease and polymerase domains
LVKCCSTCWYSKRGLGAYPCLVCDSDLSAWVSYYKKKEEKPKKLPYFWINEVIKTFGEVKTKKELTDILKANSDCRVVNQEEYEIFKKENTPAPVFNRLMLKKEPVIDWDHYATLISKRREERMQKTGMEKLPYYAALDALVTRQAMYYTKPEIDKQYNNVFYNLVMPLNYVLSRMRINGIRLDEEYMQQVKKENTEKAEQVTRVFPKNRTGD